MYKRYTVLFLLAAVCLFVVACSSANDTEQSVENELNEGSSLNEWNDSKSNDSSVEEDPHEEELEETLPDNNDPSADGTMDQEDHQEIDAELYYMNGIYDILPIDEEADRHVVLLTFDDGPKDETLVQEMLDTLEKHDAKAIFFVNGYRVEQNPELLIQIHQAGHPIGNHSWDHIDLSKVSPDEAEAQIVKVQEIVNQLTGEYPVFFRPPFGSGNETVKDIVQKNGMLYMTWSNGSLDWDAGSQTPEAVIQNVMDQLRPGSNILMHELEWTVKALDDLLVSLSEKGYRFVNPHQIEINLE